MSTRMAAEIRRPLSPAVLHILLALSDGAAHGYAIKQEAEARSEGTVRLGPGTLYTAIQRLLDANSCARRRGARIRRTARKRNGDTTS